MLVPLQSVVNSMLIITPELLIYAPIKIDEK